MDIEKLYPKKVFKYFNEISKIPRGSKKEKKISDWLFNFAKDRNFEVFQDESFNIFIRKRASLGYEDYSPLIIQGHMDMVWEKNRNKEFDFETQGIELVLENEFIKSNGTTLGADNGIAIAYILAILDNDKIKHPELEIIITTNEEDGMTGAYNLDYSMFKGKTMINLDMQEYGSIYVSSAGAARTESQFDFKLENKNKKKCTVISMELKGLSGGHSGIEIDKKLGNSNKLLGEILYHLSKKYKIFLKFIEGGNKMNAIPRETFSTFEIESKEEKLEIFQLETLKKDVEYILKEIVEKYEIKENPMLEIKDISIETNEYCTSISYSDTLKILNFLYDFPNGILGMSSHSRGLVETSVNLSVIKTEIKNMNCKIIFRALHRSSKKLSLSQSVEEVKKLTKNYGGKIKEKFTSLPWEYSENSKIKNLVATSYSDISEGEKAKIKSIHAGLECGIFSENIKGLDVVSIGPNIYGAHTPDEKMDIKSVGLMWDLLLKVFENYDIK